MNVLKLTSLLVAGLCAAALFGFYFTMSVSIMPGLDQAEPYAAITANQHIGRATQQSAFFVALIGTPIAILACIATLWRDASRRTWLLVAMAGWVGMMVVTFIGNVPLNGVIDGLDVQPNDDNLTELWLAYSVDWQWWNWWRLLLSGVSVVAVSIGSRVAFP